MTKRLVITYPVVFDNDSTPVCELRLPKDLTRAEAERVKAMIDALVIPERARTA
jgi:hypothetical protein